MSRLDEIHRSMEAATRRILALLNTTSEITADEVDKEVEIPYSCPAQRRHSHHNNDVG
jgi:hypothetical protein